MKRLSLTLCITLVSNANTVLSAEEGMPQLNPEYWAAQVFWLILIFSILYAVIWKIFLPKIVDSIENRKLKVVNDLNETQKLKENAEKKLKEYKKIIEDTKKIAKKIIEDNKKRLEKDIKNKHQMFIEEIEKELSGAEKEIKNLKKASILNINKIATDLSSELVKQIVGTEVNMSNVSAIVKEVSKDKIEESI